MDRSKWIRSELRTSKRVQCSNLLMLTICTGGGTPIFPNNQPFGPLIGFLQKEGNSRGKLHFHPLGQLVGAMVGGNESKSGCGRDGN